MLKEWIFVALNGLTPWVHEQESEEAGKARTALNAAAIAQVVDESMCLDPKTKVRVEGCIPKWRGSSIELAAALIILGEEESRWASHIQQGLCGKHPKSRVGECDHGRAVSPFQLQRNNHMTDKDWAKMQTTEGILTSTRFAARYLTGYYRRCGKWAGAFASYGLGRYRCNPEHTATPGKWEKRAHMTREMAKELLNIRARRRAAKTVESS